MGAKFYAHTRILGLKAASEGASTEPDNNQQSADRTVTIWPTTGVFLTLYGDLFPFSVQLPPFVDRLDQIRVLSFDRIT